MGQFKDDGNLHTGSQCSSIHGNAGVGCEVERDLTGWDFPETVGKNFEAVFL